MKKTLYIFILVFLISCSSKVSKDQEVKEKKLDTVLEYINYDWWLLFKDENLERYIVKGLENNNDLKILNLKVNEYAEYVKYNFGQELPTVNASINYSNVKKLPIMNNKIDQDGLMLPLTVGYELDLFGKNRRKTRATQAQLESYRYQLQSSYISYVSTLASLYFNIVKYNEIIKQNMELLRIENKILLNANKKLKNKLITEVDLNTIRQNIKILDNNISNLIKVKNSLTTEFLVIIGKNPDLFNKESDIKVASLEKYKKTNVKDNLLMSIPVSIPSSVIFSRPDVLAYEKEMKKAKIDVEVARREFLPTINISGALIFNNMSGGGFFSAGNTIRALVAGASQSLFTGGRKKANLEMMNLRYEQMFENYKKITLQAVKEISDSSMNLFYDMLIGYNNEENYLMELDKYEKDKIKFKNGLMAYEELLMQKRRLVELKIEYINSQIQDYIDVISLYKSVAGKLINY